LKLNWVNCEYVIELSGPNILANDPCSVHGYSRRATVRHSLLGPQWLSWVTAAPRKTERQTDSHTIHCNCVIEDILYFMSGLLIQKVFRLCNPSKSCQVFCLDFLISLLCHNCRLDLNRSWNFRRRFLNGLFPLNDCRSTHAATTTWVRALPSLARHLRAASTDAHNGKRKRIQSDVYHAYTRIHMHKKYKHVHLQWKTDIETQIVDKDTDTNQYSDGYWRLHDTDNGRNNTQTSHAKNTETKTKIHIQAYVWIHICKYAYMYIYIYIYIYSYVYIDRYI